jgi:hypothetical protein
MLHPDGQGTTTREGPRQLLVRLANSSMRVQIAHPAQPRITIGTGNSDRQKITLTAPAASTPFVVALLPGKAAGKPAAIGAGGELRFAEGEAVKWNFDNPDLPLCVVEGPKGLVLARATSYDSDWLKLKSTHPIYLSVDKQGKGTLANAPGGEPATVRLSFRGKERHYRIAPDCYVELAIP